MVDHILNSIRCDLHKDVEVWKQKMLYKIQHDTEAMLEIIDANVEKLHKIIQEQKL